MTTRWMKNRPELQRPGPIRTLAERSVLLQRARAWELEAEQRKPIITRAECLRVARQIREQT